jgi:hypothetical protein
MRRLYLYEWTYDEADKLENPEIVLLSVSLDDRPFGE